MFVNQRLTRDNANQNSRTAQRVSVKCAREIGFDLVMIVICLAGICDDEFEHYVWKMGTLKAMNYVLFDFQVKSTIKNGCFHGIHQYKLSKWKHTN